MMTDEKLDSRQQHSSILAPHPTGKYLSDALAPHIGASSAAIAENPVKSRENAPFREEIRCSNTTILKLCHYQHAIPRTPRAGTTGKTLALPQYKTMLFFTYVDLLPMTHFFVANRRVTFLQK
ncbi:hypothetical protein [Janthinobacterium sp. ZB1P44]|uniref:hypothetical protein n=1 Tax=Janthinobacterium sp. ZB1P44 TaxID=3424192 RepID=UPI003F28B22E